MKQHILGISRAPQFSPNSEARDAAIFAALTSRLERKGYAVDIISEDLVTVVDLADYDLVFSMARGRNVLAVLSQAEQAGLPVINSATRLLQLSRGELIQLLHQHDLPLPQTQLRVLGHEQVMPHIAYPFWLKRVDACAQQKGDVCLVNSEAEYDNAITRFSEHAIASYVIEQHIEGDLIKFYGVEGTPFFHISYPTESIDGFSKFGLEQANGRPSHFSFNEAALKQATDKAAQLTGMTVYGGDAIITSTGQFYIIDFNDWPSFSPCRREAAKAIAGRIDNFLKF